MFVTAQGVSTQGLERMARIAAGIAGDLGERGLCRHSAFFAGLSEVTAHSPGLQQGSDTRVQHPWTPM